MRAKDASSTLERHGPRMGPLGVIINSMNPHALPVTLPSHCFMWSLGYPVVLSLCGRHLASDGRQQAVALKPCRVGRIPSPEGSVPPARLFT